MAVKALQRIPTQRQRIIGFLWEAIGNADTGTPVETSAWQDRTVHLFGTWAAATIVIQGSNDPRADPAHADHASAVWVTLRDPGSTALSFTADGLKAILELPKWVRPSSSGGAGTDVDVIINARGDTR